MNRLSTKLFMMLIGVLSFASMEAQIVNTLTIEAPASIAGQYTIVVAGDWGQQLATTTTGSAIFANDGTDPTTNGCEDAITNVSGKIAMIDRGDCQFSDKALFAQNGGAVIALICNNDPAEDFPSLGAGDVADQVTIPVLGMTKADCDVIRVVTETMEVEMTFSFICENENVPDNALWGAMRGDGDFSGGLNDWTVQNTTGDSSWGWTETVAISGAFTATTYTAPTACNGFMVFNSDFLDNGGNGGMIGSGVGGCVAPCQGSLVSPTIDMSGWNAEGLLLQFTQSYRHFASTASSLVMSPDGGLTWPDTIDFNTDAVVNGPVITETIKVPMPGYENQNSVTFKIDHVGNYYFFAVDDFFILDEAFVDMQCNTNFYAAAPSFRTPSSQVSEMPFLVDIFNNGNLTAENLTVTVDIADENGGNMYSQTNNYPDLGGFALNENTVFAETYTPPAMTGVYNGSYTVSTSGDNDASNDAIPFSFEITDDLFSLIPRDVELGGGLFRPLTDGSIFGNGGSSFAPNYVTGVSYYMPNGAGHAMTSVRFGLTEEEDPASGFVDVYVYRWADGNDNNLSGADERVLVGAAQVFVDTLGGNFDIIELPIWAADSEANILTGQQLLLEDNSEYLIVLLGTHSDALQFDYLSFGTSSPDPARANYDSRATNLAFDSLGVSRVAGSFFQENVASFSDLEAAEIDTWQINQLFLEATVVEASGTNDFNDDITLGVTPNPTSDNINIEFNLSTPSDVSLELYTLDGKLVKQRNYQNIFKTSIVMTVSDLDAGMYLATIRTPEGMKTHKVVVE